MHEITMKKHCNGNVKSHKSNYNRQEENRKLQRAYISEVSFITVIYLLTIKGGGEKCNCNFIMFILSIFPFISKGPNFIWHVDRYDKLKTFGFNIHGCIDGLVL